MASFKKPLTITEILAWADDHGKRFGLVEKAVRASIHRIERALVNLDQRSPSGQDHHQPCPR